MYSDRLWHRIWAEAMIRSPVSCQTWNSWTAKMPSMFSWKISQSLTESKRSKYWSPVANLKTLYNRKLPFQYLNAISWSYKNFCQSSPQPSIRSILIFFSLQPGKLSVARWVGTFLLACHSTLSTTHSPILGRYLQVAFSSGRRPQCELAQFEEGWGQIRLAKAIRTSSSARPWSSWDLESKNNPLR